MYINNIIKKYAKRQITPLKLNNIYNFNKKSSQEKIINQSKFVYDEMLIDYPIGFLIYLNYLMDYQPLNQ